MPPDMGWGGLAWPQPGGGPIIPGGIMPGGGGGIRIPVPRRIDSVTKIYFQFMSSHLCAQFQ